MHRIKYIKQSYIASQSRGIAPTYLSKEGKHVRFGSNFKRDNSFSKNPYPSCKLNFCVGFEPSDFPGWSCVISPLNEPQQHLFQKEMPANLIVIIGWFHIISLIWLNQCFVASLLNQCYPRFLKKCVDVTFANEALESCYLGLHLSHKLGKSLWQASFVANP